MSFGDGPPPPPPSPPPLLLPEGWTAATHTDGRVYYFNRSLGTSQWAHPLATSTEMNVLRELHYTYGGGNGIDPDEFHARDAASSILEELPSTVESFRSSKAKLRAILFGPPASGKSSIMGNIYVTLKERYRPTPVYYVQAYARNGVALRDEIYNAIAKVAVCVVLLDDAQEWYDFRDFLVCLREQAVFLWLLRPIPWVKSTPKHQ